MFKLTSKLTLILFSLFIFFTISFTACFALLFLQYADNVENSRMETRAMTLADSLSKTTPDDGVTSIYNNNMMYILNTFNQNEVWLVDKNSLQISGSRSYPGIAYSQLTQAQQDEISSVLNGTSVHTDSFAALTSPDYMTVGVPVYDKYGNVKAALLLHSSMPAFNYSWYNGIEIMLFCLLVIFVISAFVLRRLIKKYIMPLREINNVIDSILRQNYKYSVSGKNNDEIGQLARKVNELSSYLKRREKESALEEQENSMLLQKIAEDIGKPLQHLNELIPETEDKLKKKFLPNLHLLNDELASLKELTNLNSLNPENLHYELRNLLEILENSTVLCRSAAKAKQLSIKMQVTLATKIILYTGDLDMLTRIFNKTLQKAVQIYPKDSILHIKITEDEAHYFIRLENNSDEIFIKQILSADDEQSDIIDLETAVIKKMALIQGIAFACEAEPGRYPSFEFTIAK